jgi:selenide,water dikinase
MPAQSHPDLLVGFEHHSDAGVVKLPDCPQALVQTVDFFTPIVDDPYAFGAIAAANSLSDLYAMGARPLTALALVCFPQDQLDAEVLVEILRGGADKVHEAGAVIVGGHSVRDPEPKYGLAVSGLVDPARMRTNAAARPGDVLVLTKPLGTGLIANALKYDELAEEDPRAQEALRSMAALNAAASDVLGRHAVKACTDVTGFGLLGHLRYMAEASGVDVLLRPAALPVFDVALGLASEPLGGGGRENELSTAPFVDQDPGLDERRVRLASDPQTSGGLLAAVPPAALEAVLAGLRAAGTGAAAVVGEVVAAGSGRIRLA